MEVPAEDYSIDAIVDAIHEVRGLLRDRTFGTYAELQCAFDATLRKYDGLGGGVEQLRMKLTEGCGDTFTSVDDIVQELIRRCDATVRECETGPKTQINDMLPFVRSTSRILVHGCGKLLALAIACAVQQRPGVHFYITEGFPKTAERPDGAGSLLLSRARVTPEGFNLRDALPAACTIIPDSSLAFIMGHVDFVLMGAHTVTEHGGLIHITGSLPIAMVAQATRTPCYVLSETFKFTKIFPLSTNDLKQPTSSKRDAAAGDCSNSSSATTTGAASSSARVGGGPVTIPCVEFVPPSMITLVFTEEGIMPPSAVADEMFRLYYTSRVRRNDNGGGAAASSTSGATSQKR